MRRHLQPAYRTPKKFQADHTQGSLIMEPVEIPQLHSYSLWVTLYNQAAPVFQAMCCNPREQTPWDLSRGLTVRHQAPLDSLQLQQVRSDP